MTVTNAGHKAQNGRRGYCTYTVYDNRTDELVAVDATAEEAAVAMGIKFSSFYTIVSKVKNGSVKRWCIEKIYDDDRQNFYELADGPLWGSNAFTNACMKDVPCRQLDGEYTTRDLIHIVGGCFCHECEFLRGEREYLQGNTDALRCARNPDITVRPDGFCSYGKKDEKTTRESTT